MNKLLGLFLLLCPTLAFAQLNAGSFQTTDTAYLYVTTNSPSTGVAEDADAVPTYRCYNKESGTPVFTGSFATLDATNTDGFYSEALSLSGLAIGDVISCRIVATIETAGPFQTTQIFQVGAGVNLTLWKGTAAATVDTAGYPKVTIKDGTGTGEIDTTAGAVAHVVLADTITTYTGNTVQTGNVYPLVDTEVAAIKAKTDSLTFTVANQIDSNVIDWKGAAAPAMTGDSFARLGAPVGASISADVAATLHPTVAGRTLDIAATGEAGVDLSNVNGTLDSTEVGATTINAIADQVWDEVLAGHLTSGSTGASLNAAGAAGDPWTTALPGAYGPGTAGKIIGDNINATISSRASQTSVDTIDDFVDTEVAAIKAKTDSLTFTTANQVNANVYQMQNDTVTAAAIGAAAITSSEAPNLDVASSTLATATALATVDDFVDTEVAAIKTKTDFLPSATAGAAGGVFIAGTNAATTITTGLTTHFIGTVDAVTSVNGLSAAALKDFFDTDSTTTYASAVGGSVVKEMADNAGGSALTVGAIADGVWDEANADHLGAGSTGAKLNSAASAGDPMTGACPGAYGAGTLGSRLCKTPDVTAGAAGGQFIAGTNAATAITTGLTTHFIGTVDTVTTYTGNTPQTGDVYPKVDTEVATIVSGVADLQARTPAALVGGRTDAIVGAYPGNIPQSGDNFARLGAPTGASIAADIRTRGTYSFKRATAFQWGLMFFNALTGAPMTTGTPTCVRALDSVTTFATGTLSVSAVSAGGRALLQVGTGDMTATDFTWLLCTLPGAEDYNYEFKIEAP